MCPERVVSPIVQLVTQSTLKNASRFARIIRVEKVRQINTILDDLCNYVLTHQFVFLQPPIPGHGMGRMVHLKEALPLSQVIDLVKEHLKLKNVRLAVSEEISMIKTVAVCAGSGGSLLKNVKADLYLTGEMSHHEVLDAVHHGTNVILCEHSNTERGFLLKWKDVLQGVLGENMHIAVSLNDRDPLTTI